MLVISQDPGSGTKPVPCHLHVSFVSRSPYSYYSGVQMLKPRSNGYVQDPTELSYKVENSVMKKNQPLNELINDPGLINFDRTLTRHQLVSVVVPNPVFDELANGE